MSFFRRHITHTYFNKLVSRRSDIQSVRQIECSRLNILFASAGWLNILFLPQDVLFLTSRNPPFKGGRQQMTHSNISQSCKGTTCLPITMATGLSIRKEAWRHLARLLETTLMPREHWRHHILKLERRIWRFWLEVSLIDWQSQCLAVTTTVHMLNGRETETFLIICILLLGLPVVNVLVASALHDLHMKCVIAQGTQAKYFSRFDSEKRFSCVRMFYGFVNNIQLKFINFHAH